MGKWEESIESVGVQQFVGLKVLEKANSLEPPGYPPTKVGVLDLTGSDWNTEGRQGGLG